MASNHNNSNGIAFPKPSVYAPKDYDVALVEFDKQTSTLASSTYSTMQLTNAGFLGK